MVFKKKEGKYKAIAAATNCTLSISASPVKSVHKDCGPWGNNKRGEINWEMGTENLFVKEDFDSLFKELVSGEDLIVAFEIAENATAEAGLPPEGWLIGPGGYEGLSIVTSLNANAPYEGDASFSATFTGTGPLNLREAPAIN